MLGTGPRLLCEWQGCMTVLSPALPVPPAIIDRGSRSARNANPGVLRRHAAHTHDCLKPTTTE